mmetsp:Transcript_16076/g.50502  ORF Transcript_16076/g.50502 Transcript_16076/m.50502 type:complete len:251 (-) Transcript_16076:31-783(-)
MALAHNTISSASARVPAMRTPWLSRCSHQRLSEKPTAPASTASLTQAAMACFSCPVSGCVHGPLGLSVWFARSGPKMYDLTQLCGMIAAMSHARFKVSRQFRYSGKLSQSLPSTCHFAPARITSPGMSSTAERVLIMKSRPFFLQGAAPTPQLPTTTVVTPEGPEGDSRGSHMHCTSRCVCTSVQPGITCLPVASTSRAALTERPGPTAKILPPFTATSPTNGFFPVPSTTVPPRNTRSASMAERGMQEL